MKSDHAPIPTGQSQLSRARNALLVSALGLFALLLAGCNLPIVAIEAKATPVLVPVVIPVIAVAPVSGGPGTTVELSGSGWKADEIVYIKLETLVDGEVEETTVAVATADETGHVVASFLYPLNGIWPEQTEVQILAESPKRVEPATATFLVIADEDVTPTSTPASTLAPTTTVSPTPTPAGDMQPSNIAHVTSSALNLRTGPGSGYAIIRALPRGTQMWVLGQTSNAYWLLVRIADGTEGWVARPYTDYRDQAPVIPVSTRPAPGYTATPHSPYPTATPLPPSTSHWRGEYFANINLQGSPIVVRDDAAINFNWGYGSPASGIPIDHFSVRWTQTATFGQGTYRFSAAVDDGVRVWVDDQLIIDQWHLASGQTYTADLSLATGNHTVRVEYFENLQIAKAKVWWEYVGGQPDYYPNWRGDYYNNRDLAGAATLTRNDVDINFNWGYGAPATGIGSDYFSVRWDRTLHFDEGTYRFYGRYDDGMRIYVDGHHVVDDWNVGSVRERSGDIYLSSGNHTVQVEYFENTGEASAHVWWQRVDNPPSHFPQWKGEYWKNRDLSGNPRVVRNDRDVNFNWGSDSPDPRIGSDNFSARWTRSFDFEQGLYRFYARSDDGVRVWVGDERIINEWHDNRGEYEYTADIYLRGHERVRIEYYEHVGAALVHVYFERIASGTATPTPTHTATPTNTNTPTPTGTVNPTSTPTPTNTATPVRPTNPYVEADPGSGSAGTEVTVRGGGFPANSQVTVYLGAPVQASSRTQPDANRYATTTTDDDGDYSVAFTMPVDWPDGTPIESGELLIMVATDNFVASASTLFDYRATPPPVTTDPTAEIDPARGGAGTAVTVSGGGFPARTTVNVHLAGIVAASRTEQDPALYATTTTDDDGDYSVAFTMPASWPGGSPIATGKLAVLVATDDFGTQASAIFDYFVDRPNPTISAQPLFGGPGTQVRVSGVGFPADTDLNLLLATLDGQIGAGNDAQVYASTTSDRNGEYNMTFSMPGEWPDGSAITAEELVIFVTTYDYAVDVSTVFDFVPAAPPAPTDTPVPPADTPTPTPEPPPVTNPNTSVSPGTGSPGSSATVSGDGFPANTNLTVFLGRFDTSGGEGDPVRYATTTSNDSGAYSVTFTVPDRWPDGAPVTDGPILVLVATSDFQIQASATFNVTGAAEQPVDLAPALDSTPESPGTIPPAPDDD